MKPALPPILVAVLIALVLAASACGPSTPEEPDADIWPQDPDGNLVLYVSNQSFAVTPVDVTIRIDGRVAVSGEFEVENQHNFVKHVFLVPAGTHRLTAVSKIGQVELVKEFTITDMHWATLDFWYYPPQNGREMPRELAFEIQDKPINFR